MAPLLVLSLSAQTPPAEAVDFTPDIQLLYRVVACAGDRPLPANVDAAVVEAHCTKLRPRIDSYRKKYADEAKAFISALRPADAPTTLVYPFGGGDLLSALTTFPDAVDITTMSLEHAGDPRRLALGVARDRQAASLEAIRKMISGLLLYNDSKTESLQKLQRGEIPGQLAFFVVALAVHGYEPTRLRYFRVQPDGSLHYLTAADLAGVEKKNAKLLRRGWVSPDFSEAFSMAEIEFRPVGGGRTRVHRHLGADLGNGFLGRDPSILRFLEAKGRVSAMTKAASYLLWRNEFSLIRDYLLSHMEVMISDSTGIPPRFATAAGFTQETWGKFEASFLGAGSDHNRDFRKLWAMHPERGLPFRYGYTEGAPRKNFHLLLTRRGGAVPPAPVATPGGAALPATPPAPAVKSGPAVKPGPTPTVKPGPTPTVKPAAAPAPSVAPKATQLEPADASVLAHDAGHPAAPGADGGLLYTDGGTPKLWLPREDGTPPRLDVRDVIGGGEHARLITSHGVAHLWRPRGYDAARAGTVVYLHGYWVNADQAWTEYRLAEQFAASGRNALFVVPESPAEDADEVQWQDLDALLHEVRRLAHLAMPDGPVVAIAHSGGFRTVLGWLSYPRLQQIVMLDGLYRGQDELFAWIDRQGAHRVRRLTMVSADTFERADGLARRFRAATRVDAVPETAAELGKRRHAEVMSMRSQYDHMGMVTSAKVIPLVLQLTPLPKV